MSYFALRMGKCSVVPSGMAEVDNATVEEEAMAGDEGTWQGGSKPATTAKTPQEAWKAGRWYV